MGHAKAPTPVKLVMPMLATQDKWFDVATQALCEQFGLADYVSPILPFDHTNYYEPEFGPGLLRKFIAFERLIDPASLAEIKLLTNRLEMSWAEDGHRRVNLDPGYLALGKFVLATTKDHAHRIYIGQGIFAEVTLAYRGGRFQAWPWTYPDYQSAAYLKILGELRALYERQLHAAASPII